MKAFKKNHVTIQSNTRSFEVADFATIHSFKDMKKKGDALRVTGATVGQSFRLFVEASVKFYYGKGNKQIDIINNLLSISLAISGMNASRLASYLECVTPHLLDKGSVKDCVAPKFYGAKGGTPQKPSELATHLNDIQLGCFFTAHPDWTKYGRKTEQKAFDAHAHAKKLLKALTKAGMTPAEYTKILSDELVIATREAA